MEDTNISVIVVTDGVVEENILVHDTDEAELLFLEKCAQIFSNFDEYTPEDKEAILEQGYEQSGNRSVNISWPIKPEDRS